MSLPFLSIVIPTYNCESVIVDCIKSILCQSFGDFEILVIDGQSTDHTVATVKQMQDSRIRVYSEIDDGIYDAMNKGVRHARGRWLYFLGGDDILYDTSVLSDLFPVLTESCDIVYGNVLFKGSQRVYNGRFSKLKLMEKNICHQSIFFNRGIFKSKGLFQVRYKLLADYEFNIRWFNDASVKKKYIEKVIAVYDERGSSFLSSDLEFINDKPRLYANAFPLWVRILYTLRQHSIVRRIFNFYYARRLFFVGM